MTCPFSIVGADAGAPHVATLKTLGRYFILTSYAYLSIYERHPLNPADKIITQRCPLPQTGDGGHDSRNGEDGQADAEPADNQKDQQQRCGS
jgi:hypothetical protein